MRTLKNTIIKTVAPIAAVAVIAAPTLTQSFPVALDNGTSIVMCAEAASNKRSGKSKAYISKIGWKKNAFTICVNSDKDISAMIQWLDKISLYTSGCKYSAKICSLGEMLPGLGKKNKTILNFASKVFSNISGVGNSAKAARSKVASLSKRYSKKGIKLTIRENGAWLVETQ